MASRGAYDGSRVEVHCDGTAVVAAATPSVVELPAGAAPRGPLCITIDAVPAVVDYHAQALRSRSGRYRHAFLAHMAATIRQTFGAERVTAQEAPAGLAEAERIDEAEEKGDAEPDEDAGALGGGPAVGFPGAQLYIGAGHAFRVDVDVHVLQAGGGAVAAAVSVAVHAALKAMRLPAVTLHEASAGVALEVDATRPFRAAVDWAQLPVLAAVLVSPTRHYVVDPTPREELALPQQLHVAANAAGQVCYVRLQQMPSRRGNAWRHAGTETTTEEQQMMIQPAGMGLADTAAVVHDAVFICQAIIAECDEALTQCE